MPNDREKLIIKLKGFDAAHYRRTEAYARQIEKLCNLAASEYASLAGTLFQPDLNKPFNFDDYPQTKKAAAQITQGLEKKIQSVIVRGTATEWQAACDKNDAFIASIIRTSRLTPEEAAQYQARNLEALQAFQQRKIDGLGLSQRVWRYVGDIKDTIELGIDVGLGEGRSAQQLSHDLRQCLQEPNKLFSRVRDKYGNLQLSKAARLYHPGQGIYRSSAKNAMRLARTEVNMAYRQAEYLRWQQLDFVVGIRIWLSNNHTVLDSKGNPQPLVDICDELVGDYPKTFLFKGWHPQCRCVVTPILSDYDEYNRERGNRLKAIVRGEAYKSMPSRRTVTAMPEKFTKYIENIADRSKGWKSQPYYIRDNFNGGTIAGGLKAGIATSLKGATETKGKPAVKNNSQPCTEFDTKIAHLKKYAYTFGLDVSKLDALRLQGQREPLRIEVERLEALEEQRWDLWVEATNKAFAPIKEMQKHGFSDLETKYRQLINQYGKATPEQYYAECIAKLQEIKAQAEAELAKAIAAESKLEYSKNMPEELKKGKQWLGSDDYVYSKEFFDLIDPKEPVPVKIHKTSGGNDSYYSPSERKVYLDAGRRYAESPYYRRALIYHEYGHVIDRQRGMRYGDAVRKLRETQIARMTEKVPYTKKEAVWDATAKKWVTKETPAKRMYAIELSERITAVYSRLNKVGDKYFTARGITKQDVIEALSAVADTLRTWVNRNDVGWGHSTSYFRYSGMREAEYIAHAFENAFIGNAAFKHFLPTEYQEMIDFINSLKQP